MPTTTDLVHDAIASADVYADMLRTERERTEPDRESLARIAADMRHAMKRAEVLALVDVAAAIRESRPADPSVLRFGAGK